MKVDIHAQSIEQILNADVINLDQVGGMSAEQRDRAIAKLIDAVLDQAQGLMRQANGIPPEKLKALAQDINGAVATIAKSPDSTEIKKSQLSRVLESIKECLGSTSGILFNAVKIAQILGLA